MNVVLFCRLPKNNIIFTFLWNEQSERFTDVKEHFRVLPVIRSCNVFEIISPIPVSRSNGVKHTYKGWVFGMFIDCACSASCKFSFRRRTITTLAKRTKRHIRCYGRYFCIKSNTFFINILVTTFVIYIWALYMCKTF